MLMTREVLVQAAPKLLTNGNRVFHLRAGGETSWFGFAKELIKLRQAEDSLTVKLPKVAQFELEI